MDPGLIVACANAQDLPWALAQAHRLSEAEQAHYAACAHDSARAHTYLIGRVLRQWVLHRLTCAPMGAASWRFEPDARGAPRPVGQSSATQAMGVCLSLAHTGSQIVVAAGWGAPLGIDVEPTHRYALRPSVANQLGTRYLTADERARIADGSQAMAPQAFIRQWTLKEAALKALGTGLRGAWQQVAPDVALHGAIAVMRWSHRVLKLQAHVPKRRHMALWCGLMPDATLPDYTIALASGGHVAPPVKICQLPGSAHSLL